MIRRETDADLLNRIANDPSVLPFFDLGRAGALDFTPCVLSPDDYVVLSNGQDAAALFEWSAPGVWECHTMFLPSCRGRRAIATARAMSAWMLDYGATLLFGLTPLDMRHVRWFNRQVGFRAEGKRDHHQLGHVEVFAMRA